MAQEHGAFAERNPFAITKHLLNELTKAQDQEDSGLFSDVQDTSFFSALPSIRVQAVSFGNKKKNALLEKRDGTTMFVSEGDRLFLNEGGQYIAMTVMEIKPRSILIQLGVDGQIIEVQ